MDGYRPRRRVINILGIAWALVLEEYFKLYGGSVVKSFSIKITGRYQEGDSLSVTVKAQKTSLSDAIGTAKRLAHELFGAFHPMLFDIVEYDEPDKVHTEVLREMSETLKKEMGS